MVPLPVLVVDSSLSVRVNLQHALMAAGFDVVACESSVAGRRAIQQRAPEVLIVEASILDSDGGALLREARVGSRGRQVPLVVLSPDGGATARILRLTSDAVDYIAKPVGPAFVVKRVQKIMGAEPTNPGVFAGSHGPARILLIDSSRVTAGPLVDRLRMDGHDVVCARAIADALGFLEVQAVDCVVLDAMSAGVSKLDMSRRIRTGRGMASVPVILVIETEDSTLNRSTLLSAGVDDAVVKTGDLIETSARIGELASSRRRPSTVAAARGGGRGFDGPRPTESFSGLISLAAIAAEEEAQAARAASTQSLPATPAPAPPVSLAPSAPAPSTPQFRDRTVPMTAVPPARSGSAFSHAATPPARPTDVPPSGSEFSPLFEQVLSVSGLQKLVGRGGLRRALERAGVEPRTLNADGLERAMPEIRRTLSIFLSKEEVERSAELITALTQKTTRSLANLRTVRGGGGGGGG